MLDQLLGGYKKRTVSDKQKVILTLVVMAMLIIFIASRFVRGFGFPNQNKPLPPQTLAEFRVVVKSTLAQKIALPPGDPVIEMIEFTEPRKLINPYFYRNLQKHDFVIHYPSLVILYRPQTGEIIEKLPVVTDSSG